MSETNEGIIHGLPKASDFHVPEPDLRLTPEQIGGIIGTLVGAFIGIYVQYRFMRKLVQQAVDKERKLMKGG